MTFVMLCYNTGMDTIRLEAEVRQVKSMVDGSYNVIINLPEYHLQAAQWLLSQIGLMIDVSIQPAPVDNDNYD
jgi:hypothetical protein